MQCSKHTEHPADGMCAYSGRPYCAAELVDVDGRLYAKDNVGKVIAAASKAAQPATPMVFMNAGGASASSSASAAAAAPLTAYRPPVRHGLHIILCLLSCGLWFPVYLVILITRAR